jgi:hypothetical protein
MCRHPRLWIFVGLAVVTVAILAGRGSILPLLLVAACPLSMLVMMGRTARIARGAKDGGRANTDADELTRLRQEVEELRSRAGHR